MVLSNELHHTLRSNKPFLSDVDDDESDSGTNSGSGDGDTATSSKRLLKEHLKCLSSIDLQIPLFKFFLEPRVTFDLCRRQLATGVDRAFLGAPTRLRYA
ncbi:hypothetical protein HAX54_016263 [Datura stramonium]|uniref:Uncharacterized protein n=1 Tax=Datura stramonium TaxID=4076 RepID=A0ABS8Y7Z7_DATST|nr:hypothetical protein [Datura stramonium]